MLQHDKPSKDIDYSCYYNNRSRSGREFENCHVGRVWTSFTNIMKDSEEYNYVKTRDQDYEMYQWKGLSKHQIVVKQVSSGKDFVTLLTMDGRLYYMGNNSFSLRCVEDDNVLSYVPCLMEVYATATLKKASSPNDTVIELNNKCIRNFIHVASGMYFMIALSSDNMLVSAGSNECGQRGVGQNVGSIPHFSECLFKEDLEASKDEILRGIVKIACGYQHCMILTRNGTLLGTGCSYQDQLGKIENEISYEFTKLSTPETKSPLVDIQCGYFCSSCIDAAGMVYVIGAEDYTHLIPAQQWTKLRTFIDDPVQFMTMSCSNSFFRTASGNVYHNWGKDYDDANKPAENLTLLQIPNVKYIYGKDNFFAVTESNQFFVSSSSGHFGIVNPPAQDARWFEHNGIRQANTSSSKYQYLIVDAFNFCLYLEINSKEGNLKDNLLLSLQKGQTDTEKNYFFDILIK